MMFRGSPLNIIFLLCHKFYYLLFDIFDKGELSNLEIPFEVRYNHEKVYYEFVF
jgi:hypothetical protein